MIFFFKNTFYKKIESFLIKQFIFMTQFSDFETQTEKNFENLKKVRNYILF